MSKLTDENGKNELIVKKEKTEKKAKIGSLKKRDSVKKAQKVTKKKVEANSKKKDVKKEKDEKEVKHENKSVQNKVIDNIKSRFVGFVNLLEGRSQRKLLIQSLNLFFGRRSRSKELTRLH